MENRLQNGIGGNVNAPSASGGWIRPGDNIQNSRGNNPMYLDPKGVARYSDPNITWQDRLGRTAKGAVKGFDTGSKWGNTALNAGAGMTGLGGANRVAGAVQGATSNKPVERKWTPGQTSGGGQNNAYTTGATGSNVKTTSAANQEALRAVLSTGQRDPSWGQTQTDGGYGAWGGTGWNPQIQGGGQGQWNGGDFSGPSASTLPSGATPPTVLQPGASGPAAPKLGTPAGDAALNYLYNDYYGRDATPEEIASHRGNPGGIDAVADALMKDEGNHVPLPEEERAQAEQDALAAIFGSGQQYQTDGSGGRVGVAGAGGGNYTYAGFDFGQDPANRDIGKSAKYAFSHLAGQAANKGVPQPRSKAEAEAWFSANIKPGMDALGFTVHKVVGDKAFISAPEHPDGAWVDFQGNSGGQGDQPLAWMAEMGTSADQNPEDIFAVQDWGGGGGSEGGMARGEEGLGSSTSGILDSGNEPLNNFASDLIKKLLEGAALDDALDREGRTTKGITPEGLKAVGF